MAPESLLIIRVSLMQTARRCPAMSHLEEPFASQQVQREVLDGFFLPATIFSHPKLFFFFPQ